MPNIIHIVHFGYKSSVSESKKLEVAQRFLALKDDCRTEDTDVKYIVSLVGGINNSPEGMSHGLEHSFVVTFRNIKDRDYYLADDPAHVAFKDLLDSEGGVIQTATVMDFEEGVFK